MKTSTARADSGERSRSANRDGKHDGQTRAGQRREAESMMWPAQRMGRIGPGLEGMAGELASLPAAGRQRAVRSLQRTHGNGFVQRLALQAKLKVGAAGDRYEQEADHMAERVMRMSGPGAVQRQEEEEVDEIQAKPLASSITPLIQRFVPSIASLLQRQDDEEELQTRGTSAAGSSEPGSAFESRLRATRGGGSPLPGSVRRQMEAGFGADFRGVRVHSGGEAAELNRAVGAQAFTHGRDIYLGEGRGNLESGHGKRLVAHELTHVVQQTGAMRLQRHTARAGASISSTSSSIQRLMNKEELTSLAGEPKHNILFHKMSAKYKAVLMQLSIYDNFLKVQPIAHAPDGKSFATAGKKLLDNIYHAASSYLLAHKTGRRYAPVHKLTSQIKPEKIALDRVAENYDNVKNFPGSIALSVAPILPIAPQHVAKPPVTTPSEPSDIWAGLWKGQKPAKTPEVPVSDVKPTEPLPIVTPYVIIPPQVAKPPVTTPSEPSDIWAGLWKGLMPAKPAEVPLSDVKPTEPLPIVTPPVIMPPQVANPPVTTPSEPSDIWAGLWKGQNPAKTPEVPVSDAKPTAQPISTPSASPIFQLFAPSVSPSTSSASTPLLIPPVIPESDYLDKVKGLKVGPSAYNWLGKQAKNSVAGAWSNWSSLGSKGLTEAQYTAIRVYTAADYLYINPVLLGDPKWLATGMDPDINFAAELNWGSSPKDKDELKKRLGNPKTFLKELEPEVMEHSAMAISGLLSLPPYTGETYRGESRPESVYLNDYIPGNVIEKRHFLSTTKEKDQADVFAKDDPSLPTPKRGIIWNIESKTGRDISEISMYPHEEEVLFMPGSKFEIKERLNPEFHKSEKLEVRMEEKV